MPGNYTLRLTVDGRTETRELLVEPDPRSQASAADLEAQLVFALGVRDQLTRITKMAATIRSVRQQIKDRNVVLAANPDAADLIESGTRLIAGLTAVEEAIHNPHAEVDYDILAGRHGGAMLYSRLSWLLMGADGHDGPPTQGMLEVGADLAEALATQESALDRLLSGDLATLNRQAQELGVPFVPAPVLDEN
jgi:hypothetical protein